MQIFTIDDLDFPHLLVALRSGKIVGRYWRDGNSRIVCATSQFVLIALGNDPEKIGVRPVRGRAEAEALALQLLEQEKKEGRKVEISP